MADLGETSRPDTAHKHQTSSWITVGLITTASIILGFAFVFRSVLLTVLGMALLVVGVVMGVTGRIMDDAH